MPEPDKYDRAIAYLGAHPDHIRPSWVNAALLGWPLFQFVTPDGEGEHAERVCGCLTTIRRDFLDSASHPAVAWTDELTAAIRADERIPDDIDDVTLDDLPIFAEWQRRIDRELGRKVEGVRR